ncbi:hypothetical protein WH8501_19645 [Crocosphaera watsonii WH 8501]|uniref:Transposase n=1 Tax=Crocosphaera watsonii WH 8501 TaxID=165597 RepID=Q4C3L4_CROWT|nr:hypothetical protein [Crocosphaera watsonii]EAM50766.1 hypothetical protein CwatDRAFT_3865 [Crocosphaera watsonii WH 8501]
MSFLAVYESHFTKHLTQTQFEAFRILLWLLTVHKQVRIERLAACFPLPILYQSRRKHIQRFLVLSALAIPRFWFPVIKAIICKEFKTGSLLIITIPEFLTKSAIAKHRSLTGSGFEQSDRRFPQPTVCCQILS